jgi:hypothetical protein
MHFALNKKTKPEGLGLGKISEQDKDDDESFGFGRAIALVLRGRQSAPHHREDWLRRAGATAYVVSPCPSSENITPATCSSSDNITPATTRREQQNAQPRQQEQQGKRGKSQQPSFLPLLHEKKVPEDSVIDVSHDHENDSLKGGLRKRDFWCARARKEEEDVSTVKPMVYKSPALRSQIMLPPSFEPHECSVVIGKTKICQSAPGTVSFNAYIKSKVEAYRN